MGSHQERLFSDTDPDSAVNLAFSLYAGVSGQLNLFFSVRRAPGSSFDKHPRFHVTGYPERSVDSHVAG
jgi:hypothetical protein